MGEEPNIYYHKTLIKMVQNNYFLAMSSTTTTAYRYHQTMDEITSYSL